MSVLVNAPPAPSIAKSSRFNRGSSGDRVLRFAFGAGPSCATGLPFLAMIMRSPRSARATNWDRRVLAAWTFTILPDIVEGELIRGGLIKDGSRTAALRVVGELQNARPGNVWYASIVRHKGSAAGPYGCGELQRVGGLDAGRGA